MQKIALFAAVIAGLVVIVIDAWLSARTITPGALADSISNRLIVTTAKAHYDEYLLHSD